VKAIEVQRVLSLVAVCLGVWIAGCVVGLATELPDPIAVIDVGPGTVFEDAMFSPNGEFLAIGCTNGSVKLFSTQTWDLVWESSVFGSTDTCRVGFSPDGRTLAVSQTYELDVVFLNSTTGRETRRITLSDDIPGKPGHEFYGVMHPDFSPDGSLLACSEGGTGSVKLVDVRTGEELGTPILHDGSMGHVRAGFSPDGSQLASVGPDGGLVVIDVATQEELFRKGRAKACDFAYAPDGTLYTTTATHVEIWDTSEWTKKSFGPRVGAKPGGASVAISPDNTLLARALALKLSLWVVETKMMLSIYDIPSDGFTWMRFSPDGSLLASAGDYSSLVEVWEVADLVGE
jgi:WD40 repeat protein